MVSETTRLINKFTADSPPTTDVLVCTLAYALALLFVITPLSQIFRGPGSRHLIATTTVWFHPVRRRGNLIEVLLYTLKLLMLAVSLCIGAMVVGQTCELLKLPHFVNVTVLSLWMGFALGLLGFLKMRAKNASFNTASSAAIIFLVSVLIREEDLQFGDLPVTTIVHYFEMVFVGAMISGIVSLTCYRKTSLAFINHTADELEQAHISLVREIVKSLGHELSKDVTTKKLAAGNTLASLKQQAQYARYEKMFSRYREKYEVALQRVRALEHQGMLIGGMVHCVSTVNNFCRQQKSNNLPKDGSQTFTKNSEYHFPSVRAWRPVMTYLVDAISDFVVDKCEFQILQAKVDDCFAIQDQIFTQMAYSLPKKHIRPETNCHLHSDEGSHDLETPIPKQVASGCALLAHHLQGFAREICGDLTPIISASRSHVNLSALNSSEDVSATHLNCVLSNRNKGTPEPVGKQFEQAMYEKRTTNYGIGPRIWRVLRVLRSRNVLHGLRVGMGAIILSLPAYLDSTRETFQLWHGEWAVITYMIIMARNLGAMSHNIPLRLVGTSIGALVGILVSLFSSGYGLVGWSSITCFVCYRRILSNKDPVYGRFVLLSYNLVSLYRFSSQKRSTDIYHIAFHRVVSVTIGVLWAVFITVTIWPQSARMELRSKLCIQWMRMGMIWKRDVLATCSGSYQEVPGERELQGTMATLEELIKICPNEIRLRGKFDPAPYQKLLESTQTMLDAYHSLNTLIKDEPQATPGELTLLQKTEFTRRELCNVMFLQFYTASTSVRLGFPVPEFLPPPDLALRQLASTLSQISGDMGDFLLIYTYMTVVLTLSSNLKQIHDSLRLLFGALDDDILFAYV